MFLATGMFAGKNIWQVFNMGGFTMYILLGCSVVSIAVMLERVLTYTKKSRVKRVPLMSGIREALGRNSVHEAIEVCEASPGPLSNVAHAGLKLSGHEERAILSAMEREITVETNELEKLTSIVGTIGNIGVYIGLFGTVLGIVGAFQSLALEGADATKMGNLMAAIAEALVCTATGLLVAIPAVAAYNYFVRRIETFVKEMDLVASETMDLLSLGKTE